MKKNSNAMAFFPVCAAIVLCLAALSVSCNSGGSGAAKRELSLAKSAPAADMGANADGSLAGGSGAAPREEPAAGAQAVTAQAGRTQPRKLVKTGEVRLESRDLDKAEAAIMAVATGTGGYAASTSHSESSLYAVIRVPQEKFDQAMEGLKSVGKLKSRNASAQDVTLQYVDMESRIATRKILRDRYTEYLKRAEKVEDLLAVEKSLNDVLSELDSMEASFKALADQVDYATISVSVDLPPEATPASERSFAAGLLKVWDGFIGFLYFLAYAILDLILFGVPAILLIGLLYWLCFGKLGLLRKFFKRLSGSGSGKAPDGK